MTIIYNIAVFFYHLFISIAGLFNQKAYFFTRGRKNWLKKLKEKIEPSARYVWFHCSSLGEFEQGRPVIESIRNNHAEFRIIITFFSPSGFEIRKNYPHADIICYLPKDTKSNASLFLEIVHPEKAFFVKYEFWHHFIHQCHEKRIPLYLISGIFRPDQAFFSGMPWGKWFRRLLENFSWFFLQDENSASLLSHAGIKIYTITGDTRFDRVVDIARSSQPLPIVEKFSQGHTLMVAGSTWKPDEDLIVPYINQQVGLKFIIVPHEVTQGNINRLIQMLKKPVVLLSKASEETVDQFEVMIVDSVGKLSAIYRYGTYAYIGGGFGAGIHNILEAATFGLPVFFGPNYGKFREAVQLVEKNAAFPVHSTESLRSSLLPFMENSGHLKMTSKIAEDYVSSNQGATKKIIAVAFQ
jgi:3-deoxy-D-manno-octulosonic-acid transferase